MTEAPASGQAYEPVLTDVKKRSEAVFQALGAASVCWESMAGTGVFDSSRAEQIGLELLNWLDEDERSRQRDTTAERLLAKAEAEPAPEWNFERAAGHPGPWRRWRQLEDGTWAADGGPLSVFVERPTLGDRPFIYVIGNVQEMNPGAARWLSLRLSEATGIVEASIAHGSVIP